MDEIIIIFSEDKVYGERLLAFFQEQKDDSHVMLVTNIEKLCETGNRVTCVLALDGQSLGTYTGRVVRLMEEKEKKGGIYMYQPAANIVNQFWRQLRNDTYDDGCYLCVFSPEGGSRGTELALEIAKQEMVTKRVIYISLSGFPVIHGTKLCEEYEVHPGFTNLLAEEKGSVTREKIQEMIFEYDGMDVLAPVQHFKDLLDMTMEELRKMLDLLQTECGYQKVVIELGQLFEYSLDVLEYMDQVVIASGSDLMSRVRLSVLRNYLKMEGKERVAERMKVVE